MSSRVMSLGESLDVEQDLEFAVRQLVEVGLRALSRSVNDPFTAIAVLDRLGASLCELAGRALLMGLKCREGHLRLARPTTNYSGLLDAMFHMMRQSGATLPAVMIRLLEVLTTGAPSAAMSSGRMKPAPPARRSRSRKFSMTAAEGMGDASCHLRQAGAPRMEGRTADRHQRRFQPRPVRRIVLSAARRMTSLPSRNEPNERPLCVLRLT